ncbi:MAG: pseudouridine synthase [Calditrichia bacterium]
MAMKDNEIRLNRFMAMCGIGSRRKCDELIAYGAVRVNGRVVHEMGMRVNPAEDEIEFQGQVIRPQEKKVYYLLNKPQRTVTTASDEKRRKTVLHLLPQRERIFPVGRLDYNTTGALLLTNDGDLAYFLAHPRYEISKKYRVLLDRRLRPVDLHNFSRGLELDGVMTSPCKIEEIRIVANASYLEVELHEGRNRQIRRMFEQLGYQVKELQRVEFAGLRIDGMHEGEWRRLKPEEIRKLKKMVSSYKKQAEDKE